MNQLRNKNGFSFVELIIVIAITTILAVGGTISYLGLRNKKALDSVASKIVFDLRATAGRSKAQENDMGWGIRFTNGTNDYYEIWSGQSYATGTKVARTNLSFVALTNPPEGSVKDIAFGRVTGIPKVVDCATLPGDTFCTISLSNNSDSKTITINSNGRIDY